MGRSISRRLTRRRLPLPETSFEDARHEPARRADGEDSTANTKPNTPQRIEDSEKREICRCNRDKQLQDNKAVVGKTRGAGQLDIIASEQEKNSESVRYGIIKNPEETSMRIARIIERLERKAFGGPPAKSRDSSWVFRAVPAQHQH